MSASAIKPDRVQFWIITLVVVVLWIAANILFYWWLDDSPAQKGPREPDPAVLAAYEEHAVKVGRGEFRYRLLPPAKIIEGRRYPLVVYLHGSGETGTDNCRQLNDLPSLMVKPEYRERFDCFVLAPQCPDGLSWTSSIIVPPGGSTSEPVTPALPSIETVLSDQPIDRQRVYLTGFSMGGFGTWGLAALKPELFAAIVPVCGGGNPSTASNLVNIPTWAVHGGRDKVVVPEQSQQMIDALTTARGQPRLNILPDAGHESTWAYALDSGVLDWMFQQRQND